MSYADYLNGRYWRRRRRMWLREHGAWCRSCGSRSGIQLHHRTYDTLGNEADSDLVALCDSCHRAAHSRASLP